jgi:hypothetical protein
LLDEVGMSSSGEAEATVAEVEEVSARSRGPLWAAGLPARAILVGLLQMYRSVVAPLLPARCRFYPSCSAYALEAVGVHGAAKGLVLAVWRVLRCSPATAGGSDPVPRRGAWRPAEERRGISYDAVIPPNVGEA